MSEKSNSQQLDDIISAAMREPESEVVQDAKAETVEAKPDDGAEPIVGRDEKGRFAKKGQEPTKEDAAPDEATASEAAPVVEDVKDQPDDKAQSPKWDDGHFRGWSSEQREKFNSLDPATQDVVMQYKADFDRQFTTRDQQFADFRKRFEPFDHVSRQYQDVFAAQGMSPVEALQGYANIDRTLRQGTWDQKVQVFSEIARLAGIPWSPDLLTLDADVNALRSEHDNRAHVAQANAETNRLKAELEELRAAQLQTQITAFASAANPDGTPKHPHFETVKAQMGALLNSGAANTLEDAYALAVQPITAAIEAERARLSSETQRRQTEALSKAKKAAPLKASPTVPTNSTKAPSLDDVISAAMEQAGWS